MSDLSVTLAEARDFFLEADFEQATEKFEAAKVAATAASDADAAVAADTGLAEVAIQQKSWDAAMQLLESAVAATGAKPASLVRAHYMLGLARMAQRRAEEARTEFEAALEVARVSGDDHSGAGGEAIGVRGDIEDRLAQLDELESLEEDDLLEIAMEFGASAAADEYGPGEEDDEEDDEGADEDEDDDDAEAEEEDEAYMAAWRKGAAADVDDDDEEDEEEEAEAEAKEVSPRKRKAANGGGGVSEEKRAKSTAAADAPAGVANGDSHAAGDGDKKE